MKKITICFVLTTLLFACKKTEIPVQDEQEIAETQKSGKSVPTVTTTVITYLTSATATTGGNVSTSGGGSQTTERGICYKTSPYPTVADTKVPSGSGSGDFISVLSGLSPNTTYYVKAYAINSTGVTYGNQVVFATLQNYGTVTDYDGNLYHTITIGAQTWTIENLKTTHYRDGTAIPNITNNTDWHNLTAGAYCNYDNDPTNVANYGRLYNWYAVNDAHNLAPAGWHVPTFTDWYTTLMNYLGGCDVAGKKLKDNVLWNGDNSSGFKALPGGARGSNGSFFNLNFSGYWWTSTTGGSNPDNAWFFRQDGYDGSCTIVNPDYNKKTGYSVRLVKD